MANSFQTQSLVEKAVAFKWAANPGLADHIQWERDLISAQKNTGATVTLRRPSRVRATRSGLESAGAYDLPGTTQPAVGYSTLTDAVVPLTISSRFEANLQVSMEELTFKLDRNDAMDRYIEPAIVSLKDQINEQIAKDLAIKAGQSVVQGTAYSSFAQNFEEAIAYAKNLTIQRGGGSQTSDRALVAHMGIMPQVGPSAATVFHYADASRSSQNGGVLQPTLAGCKLFESAVLNTVAATAQPAGAAVAAPGGGVINGVASGYASTFSVNMKTLGNAVLFPAGTIVSFNGVNWIVPTTQRDTGRTATFTLTADVTSAADGTAVFVLAEALVYGGDFRNTTLTTAIPTDTAVTIIRAGTTMKPSWLITKGSVVGCSPEIDIPKGVAYSKKFNAPSGVQFAMIEDHWPGTLQNIVKLVAFVGIAAPKPEGIVQIV